MSHSRTPPATPFVRVFFGFTLACLLGTGFFNLFMDPFDLFGMPGWQGVNAEKTQYQKVLRMAKAHAVRFYRPRGIILGTSRAEYLDPTHPGWDPDARPVYNLAIQSSRIHEVWHYLRHAQAQRPLKQVVLALDEFMFSPHILSEQGFDEARLDKIADPWPNTAWINDLVMALFSFDALKESFLTLVSQSPPSPVIYQDNGARYPNRFQYAIDKVGGHHRLFVKHVAHGGGNRKKRRALYDPYDTFRQIIEFCRQNGIDLRLLINPPHAWYLEKLRLTGTEQEYMDWKRHLVDLLASEAREANASPFPLWDFSGFNSVTTEPVPSAQNKNAKMRWYWEDSHYKTETGHLILDRVFGLDTTELRAHPDFGVLLTEANFAAQTQRLQAGYASYRKNHPGDVAEITRLLGTNQTYNIQTGNAR